MKRITIFFLSVLGGLHAAAVTLTVDTELDQLDVPAGAELSLREAIRDAAGGDLIDFDPSLSGQTIILSAGLGFGALKIDAITNLTIDASSLTNLTLDVGGPGGHFEIRNGSVAVLNNLTLINGRSVGFGGSFDISDGSDVTLLNCTLKNNQTVQNGGAIRARSSHLTLSNCVVQGNVSLTGNGGGIFSDGNSNTISILQSRIEKNRSGESGGGIYAAGGLTGTSDKFLDLIDSTVVHNSSASGGGLFVKRSMLRANRSTIAYNQAKTEGGGLLLSEYGDALLRNSTLAGNRSQNGAGIFAYPDTSPTLTLCTVSDNEADLRGGGIFLDDADLTLRTSAVAANRSRCGADILKEDGSITRLDQNLVGDNQSVETDFPAGSPNGNGDIAGTRAAPVDPLLARLGYYGGLTPTMIPLAGSPLVDAGVTNPLVVDQRSFVRPVGTVDIGAVERTVPLVVTTALDEDDGGLGLGAGDSLREILAYGIGASSYVQFDASLASATLQVTNEIFSSAAIALVDGSGLSPALTVDGGGSNRLFRINLGSVCSFHGLTFSNGVTTSGSFSGGGAVRNVGTLTLDRCALVGNADQYTTFGLGGAVYTQGRMIIQECQFSGNRVNGPSLSNQGGAIRINGGDTRIYGSRFENNFVVNGWGGAGGAVAAYSSADVLIDNCTFTSNSCLSLTNSWGGALFILSGELCLQRSTVNESVAQGQTQDGLGGGLYANADIRVADCTFADNTASPGFRAGHGGGVYLTSSFGEERQMLVENTTFSGNYGVTGGAALYATNTEVRLRHVTIAGNFSDPGGGSGIQMTDGSTVRLENCLVAGNVTPLPITGADIQQDGGFLFATGTNLIGNNTTVSNTFPVGPLVGTFGNLLDPVLDDLSDNGGPTATRALKYGSPAIDAAVVTEDTPICDQRGFLRPRGSAPDLGAYESGNDFDFSTWALESIPAASNMNFDADLETDEIVNGWEYGLGLDPLATNDFPLSFSSEETNEFVLAIPFRPGAVDLVYILDETDDLLAGFSEVMRFDYASYCASTSGPGGTVEIDLDTETLTFRPQPQPTETNRFWSLRLQRIVSP